MKCDKCGYDAESILRDLISFSKSKEDNAIIKAAFAYCKATHEDDQILLHKLVEAVCSHPDYEVK